MDGIYPAFLCSLLLQAACVAAQLCSPPVSVHFAENNGVGDVVQTIEAETGVVVSYSPENSPDLPFAVTGNQLIATKVLDYETVQDSPYSVKIDCTKDENKITQNIFVFLINTNDNSPVFDQSVYNIPVNELSPIDSTVGQFAATDLDKDILYYRLTSESTYFKLKSPTSPEILVNAHLDFDKIKEVKLVLEAQDTPLSPPPEGPSHTATTTIMVSISDVDNRPPWFKPCNEQEVGGTVVCLNAGYMGRVKLNEQETGVLPLEPGPLYAIDGDKGINEAITYSLLSGNEAGLFHINPTTGNVTMLKPTDVLGPIRLTVMAAQRTNSHQFATTFLTINITEPSLHEPKFERTLYEALITSKGSMALDVNDNLPLEILATDEDYSSVGGRNPHITYSVTGSDGLSIIGGFLFLTKDLPDGTLSLQIRAVDTSNYEAATTQLRVELKLGSTTTSLPLSTTDFMTTTSVEESTTNSKTTNEIMSTTDEIMSTTDEIMSTTDEIMSTTDEIMSTTDEIMSTTTEIMSTTNPTLSTGISATSHSVTKMPSGEFRVADMAALGATLGVLLFVSLVVIGVLVYYMQRGKKHWKKIQEVAMFRSSLGQSSGGQKEGMQYTNETFHRDDDDGDNMGSGGPNVPAAGYPPRTEWNPPKDVRQGPSAPMAFQLPDGTSDNGSDKTDDEKDVKPILTKERRVEEGYKSVWFKEDIDPNAKEEVVIIPGSREEESEGEDEDLSSSSRRIVENGRLKGPKVAFADPDLDSGLGVKMEGPGEDSESDRDLNVDL